MEIAKQASWGALRDNMALGVKANGIDGGHILRPKTHLYATGKVMQNNQPLAALADGQATIAGAQPVLVAIGRTFVVATPVNDDKEVSGYGKATATTC